MRPAPLLASLPTHLEVRRDGEVDLEHGTRDGLHVRAQLKARELVDQPGTRNRAHRVESMSGQQWGRWIGGSGWRQQLSHAQARISPCKALLQFGELAAYLCTVLPILGKRISSPISWELRSYQRSHARSFFSICGRQQGWQRMRIHRRLVS